MLRFRREGLELLAANSSGSRDLPGRLQLGGMCPSSLGTRGQGWRSGPEADSAGLRRCSALGREKAGLRSLVLPCPAVELVVTVTASGPEPASFLSCQTGLCTHGLPACGSPQLQARS